MRFRESGGRFELADTSAWVQRVIGYAGLSGALDTADGHRVAPVSTQDPPIGVGCPTGADGTMRALADDAPTQAVLNGLRG
jgi:hypothetical protein